MFDKLSRSMERARKLMTGSDRLTAENMKEPLKEIRRALLEADVSLPVVRRFIKKVEEKALGQQVSHDGFACRAAVFDSSLLNTAHLLDSTGRSSLV
jgi:signal recognition particle GTPase